jgi:hypothetical protein
VGVLIWTLWVIPVAASVAAAQSVPLEHAEEIELDAGERVGIWGSGISAMLGTLECSVSGPGGTELSQRGGPSLSWDDTLWWMTPKRGFEQQTQFTAADEGVHTVTCSDSLATYDGEFLVAGDAFGSGSIGLGRTGGSDFAVGTALAFGAVFCLPVAMLLPVVILIRRRVTRGRRARHAGRAGPSSSESREA